MQNRHIGDIRNYSELILIKHLFDKKAGVIWYLYPNEENDDEEIDYKNFNLKDKEIENIIKTFSNINEDKRNIQELENILEKNDFKLTCFDECIDKSCDSFFSNDKERKEYRDKWFKKALEKVKNCDVVFADPDNGITLSLTNNITKAIKSRGKYIYLEEIDALLENHKIVIISQDFGDFRIRDMIVKNKKDGLEENLKNSFNFYAINFKKKDGIGYIVLSKEHLKEKIETFCNEFQEEFELIIEENKNNCNKGVLVSTCIICGKPVKKVSQILKEKSTEIDFEKNIHTILLPLCEYHNKLIFEGKIKLKGFFTTSKGTEIGYEEE